MLVAQVKTESHTIDYGHVIVSIFEIENDTVPQSRNDLQYMSFSDYDGLEISCQLTLWDDFSNKEGDKTPYGFEVGFNTYGKTNLRMMESQIKILRKIRKGENRLYEKFGDTKGFPEYVLRILETLKVKYVISISGDTVKIQARRLALNDAIHSFKQSSAA